MNIKLNTPLITIAMIALIFSYCQGLWAYSGGSGTYEDPYQIATAQDLIDLGNEPNDYDKHFILTADIDLSGYTFDRAVIAPDRNDEESAFVDAFFSGYFDGQGHVISHLCIQGNEYIGLFGRVDTEPKLDTEAKIVNFGLDAVIVNLGLDAVNVSGKKYVGGLVGFSSGSIEHCYSRGTVSGDGSVGGLVGNNWDGSISSCYSTGIVIGGGNIGGLAGKNMDMGSISWSYSTGTVVSNENGLIGGLVGFNWGGSIWSSYSTATVIGEGGFIGGLVAINANGSISSSYSTGAVYCLGAIGELAVCGLVGRNNGIISSSFWDTQTSGQTESGGGIGLTTVQMQDVNTFLDAGWDLTGETANGTSDLWQLQKGAYPILTVHSDKIPVEPNGAGTWEEPYLITEANELGSIGYRPLAHYRLAADIDLSGITWGTAVVPWFGGSLDGNGFTIRSLHIQGTGHLGLFAQISSALIKNMGLEDVSIEGTGNTIGTLVGYNHGTLSSTYSNGTVNGEDIIGSLVGYNNLGHIISSYSNCTISGHDKIGGLVGESFFGQISSSYSAVTITGGRFVDGLIRSVDGLIGFNIGFIISSFWNIETSHLPPNIYGLTTAQMQDINTYLDAGWDFIDEKDNGLEDIWFMPENSYPIHAWNRGMLE